MEQQLRKITLKLDVSGTAQVINNTKLYKGSYGFVALQVYVPVTQNRDVNTKPLCTVSAVITDERGQRLQAGAKYYNMIYVETVKIGNFDYLLFERCLPKSFTDVVGELEFFINYLEINTDGKVAAKLPTNLFKTIVDEGGEADGEIDVDLKSQEVAQINANTIDISLLWAEVDEFRSSGILGAGVADITTTQDSKLVIEYSDPAKEPKEISLGLTEEQAEEMQIALSKKQNKIRIVNELPTDSEVGDFICILLD